MSATSISSKPAIGQWIDDKNTLVKTFTLFLGVALLSALAQIAIPLPFTPVPITGQTFGVALLSLMLGRKWGFSTVAAYVALGSAGVPIFAEAHAGLKLISAGYLVGMCVSAFVIGSLADQGWSKSFGRALVACFTGSACVYFFGVLVLSNFVPATAIFAKGIIPFIPGDFIKCTLAASIAVGFNRNT